MKICGRCDKPIRPGQKYTEYPIASPNGPGTTVYLHDGACRRVPYQTTQVASRR